MHRYINYIFSNHIDYSNDTMNFRSFIGYQIISFIYLIINYDIFDFNKKSILFLFLLVKLWSLKYGFISCFEYNNDYNIFNVINSNMFNFILNIYNQSSFIIILLTANIIGNHTKSTYLSILSIEPIIRVLYLKNSFNFIDYCMCWLLAHFCILFLAENLLLRFYNSNFLLKSHEISLCLLGILHPIIVISIIRNDILRAIEINTPIDIYHHTPIDIYHHNTYISSNIFVGYLLRDCINGLIYSKQYRNRFKYNLTNWIHHIFFILITVVDINVQIYSHEYAYLILAEISTIFLYLKEATQLKIFKRIFFITFFIFRIVFYFLGFLLTLCRLYNNYPNIHPFYIYLTPVGIFLAFLLNLFWFSKMIFK